jgi:NAD(P)-dependent dehydrogenase (short-subunit alcohol dehydrogenase family)
MSTSGAELDGDALDAWRGFTEDELATCVRVLRACAATGNGGGGSGRMKDEKVHSTHKRETDDDDGDGEDKDGAARSNGIDVFNHPRQKSLRVALMPLLERFHGRLFHGKSKSEYVASKEGKRERNRRKMAERAADRAKLDLTRLRKERLDRLAALEGANAAHGALPLIPDGVAAASSSSALAYDDDDEEDERGEKEDLNLLRACYVCKCRYRTVHHFYASLCPECAALNWEKRTQTADLRGKFCLVTGARVKIGYRITLKLLRAGAYVIATTRFPMDALKRFEEEEDSGKWMSRLQILAMDLRDLPGLEKLCAHLLETLPRLDVLINNACQTVRRPPAYYKHLLQGEARAGFNRSMMLGANRRCEFLPSADAESREALSDWRQGENFKEAGWMAPSAAMSQLQLLESDKDGSAKHFPEGALDINGQQVDLRTQNSWTMRLGEVETPELLEVLAVNAAAPFVLNGKLRPLMARTVARDKENRVEYPAGFIVNVSAMEGKFYRYKTPNHPHTNMAKAALNMMTATSAQDYATEGIYVCSIDTGWINLEQPLEDAARVTAEGFQTPIDEEDAAARVLATVFEGYAEPPEVWPPPYGKFYKDYRESEW